MFCGQCGKNNSDDSVVCSGCGAKLRKPVNANAGSFGSTSSSTGASGSGAPYVNNSVPFVNSPINYGNHSALVLKTDRAWWKMLLLGIVTLGIYPMVANELMVHDLNLAASRSDGKRTLSPSLAGFLGAITLFVYMFVWYHGYSNRLGAELRRRGINYQMGAFYFWIFDVLLAFTIVCPVIYLHKVIKSTNLINADFNSKGM